jgi:PAS domain S-box-containing protein
VTDELGAQIAELQSQLDLAHRTLVSYRSLAEDTVEGMFRVAPDGAILWANAAMAHLYGHPSSEQMRDTLPSLWDTFENNSKQEQSLLELLQEHGQVVEAEYRVATVGGNSLTVSITARAVVDADGTPVHFEGSAVDVTARREADKQIAGMARFPNENPSPVLRVEAKGDLMYCNAPASRLLEQMNATDDLNLPESWIAACCEALESATPIQLDTIVGDRHYTFDFAPVADSGYVNLYGRDVTRIKSLLADVERARDEALMANQAKNHFLANMSHELRTPLNAILGYSEFLVEEAQEQGRSEDVGDLTRIRAAGKHLLEIISDILDISKIEAGKMGLMVELIEVDIIIEGIKPTIEPLAAQNNNRFAFEIEGLLGTMNSDRIKIQQILTNLLSNACKFTSGGEVTLTASRPTIDGAEWLQFQVSDTGIGIARDQLAVIFEPFRQADSSTTREYGGTGLGLTICRRFCRLLGGDVTVESAKGVGSTFTVQLPTRCTLDSENL